MHTTTRDTIKTHCWQLMRFGLVGIAATVTHFTTVYLLVEQVQMRPLVANVFGYFLAFNVSFLGHRHFTFRHKAPISETIGRFLIVATFGFSFNESLFYIFLLYFHQYYPFALALTLTITPLMTFILGKMWVFPPSPPCQPAKK